ncbi:MAG: BamA/TamA family outer membrane protein [Candidatus Aminicenantes bacterium]|nr:MAG: BamA/TamA family outer membrane protein [Candidatus Aminicenantes bacterium]
MMGKLSGYFMIALIIVPAFFVSTLQAETAELEYSGKSLSVFPILMYDTDIGLGYGAKAKFVNYLSVKESFDLILFGSTKGERLFDFIFSIPDIEIRQGKIYAISLDINAKYNKILIDNFYGIGSDSKEEDLTNFTYEIKELKLTLGRGFSSFFVCQASYYFRNIHYYDVEENKAYTEGLKSVGEQFSPFLSLLVRYDSSDSQIHPTHGFRFEIQSDLAYGFLGNKNASYMRFILDLRKYLLVFGQKDVLAFRLRFQKISGDKIPLFELSVLGGGTTENAMRGYKMNRFQDKGKILLNAEYRFPIWKRLGGNIFVDYGTVWPSLKKMDFQKSVIDVGWGLRYYLKNFIARFDMGFSNEGFGIYFQFNHIF